MIGLAAAKLKLAPYLMGIKLALVAVLCLLALRAGCSLQANRDASIIADKNMALKDAATALRAANQSLAGAADALELQNQDNAKRAEEAARSLKAAEDAKAVADKEAARLAAQSAKFADALQKARAKLPDCEAIMSADVVRRCGL